MYLDEIMISYFPSFESRPFKDSDLVDVGCMHRKNIDDTESVDIFVQDEQSGIHAIFMPRYEPIGHYGHPLPHSSSCVIVRALAESLKTK
jgi:hypothetical protein